jgi:hypothetical protein
VENDYFCVRHRLQRCPPLSPTRPIRLPEASADPALGSRCTSAVAADLGSQDAVDDDVIIVGATTPTASPDPKAAGRGKKRERS